MRLNSVEMLLLHSNLEKRGFYEDIIFESKTVKKDVKRVIEQWIFYLQKYRGIRIEKFKKMFYQLNEIAFPIKISKSYCHCSILEIQIIDNEGKEYYMSNISINDYDCMVNYIISRRNSPLEPLVEREFHYKISKDSSIILIKTGIMGLKEDGKNDDIVVDFVYDYEENTTQVTLSSFVTTNIIKICYPTINRELEKRIYEFLKSIKDEISYYYDVFQILKWILTNIESNDISLSIITEVENEIYSQIAIIEGKVKKYTYTQISEEEVHIIVKNVSKDLSKFLIENNRK